MKVCLFTLFLLLGHCVVLHWDFTVTMRDGTDLATVAYYDATQPLKKNPVILIRTPYGTKYDSGAVEKMVKAGFVVVVQDIRGMLDSKGNFTFFRYSGQDNIDTIKWIQSMHWSNGDVGTIGFSAPGITQYMSVHGNPYEEVKSPKFQCVGAASPLAHEHISFQGGALRHSLTYGWLKAVKQLWYYEKFLENEGFSDAYWGPVTITDPKKIHWPAIHFGGWYDIFQKGILDGFKMYRDNPDGQPQYLVMMSGGHCVVSNMVFPGGEGFKGQESWYEYCPKLYDKIHELPIRNFVNFYVVNLGMNNTSSEMGNFWVSVKDFPENQEVKYYLASDHTLTPKASMIFGRNSNFNNGTGVTFVYDPNHPTPTIGGNNLMLPCGPRDQSENEKREDNIVFTTEPLESPLAIFGNIKVNLVVSTNCTDTDFACRLTDFDGVHSYLLNDGILRMKWMEDPSTPNLVVPNKQYTVSVDLWNMAAMVSPGHSLRVTCTSSNYPRFVVNGNSGKLLKDEKVEDYKVAQNTVYFGEGSYVSLPVVDLKVFQENKVHSFLV